MGTALFNSRGEVLRIYAIMSFLFMKLFKNKIECSFPASMKCQIRNSEMS